MATSRFIPAAVAIGAITAAASYVRWQLGKESHTMDKFFASYNTPESEAARRRVFEGSGNDPRTSAFNVLGWKKQ